MWKFELPLVMCKVELKYLTLDRGKHKLPHMNLEWVGSINFHTGNGFKTFDTWEVLALHMSNVISDFKERN